jgi:hypothetical protein
MNAHAASGCCAPERAIAACIVPTGPSDARTNRKRAVVVPENLMVRVPVKGYPIVVVLIRCQSPAHL